MSGKPLRVLIVHNRYQQPGGEDVAVTAEAELLTANGHEVARFESSNDELGGLTKVHAAARTVWSRHSRSRLEEVQARVQPDVVHFHNTFPLLSPSVYYAQPRKAVVVQTLHNYRLVCPTATLMRSGRPCEDCVGRFAWPGIMHACYRGSRSATLATAVMVQTHRALRTWSQRVDAYVALTPFARDIFVRGGLAPDRIHVKPNFVAPDPGIGTARRDHFLFVGRFEEGKGINVLLSAWRQMQAPPPLRLVGSGPLNAEVAAFAAALPSVTMVGRTSRERVIDEMRHARALIAPMLWYENFPLSVCEAMATGCPVIAADTRNLCELLGNGEAGLFFDSGNGNDLARAVTIASQDAGLMSALGAAGRRLYEAHYTAATNYRTLMSIYEQAAAARHVIA